MLKIPEEVIINEKKWQIKPVKRLVEDKKTKEVISVEEKDLKKVELEHLQIQKKYMKACLLYTSPSPRDRQKSRMPSSA